MLVPSIDAIGRSADVNCPLIVNDVFNEAKFQPSFGLESFETATSTLLIVWPDPLLSIITMKR